MITVATQCERLSTNAPKIVTGNANTAGDALPSRLAESMADRLPVYRMIQNLDANNPVYVAYGCDCAIIGGNYHKVLGPLQDLNVPTMERVSVMGAAGWSVATVEMYRNR